MKHLLIATFTIVVSTIAAGVAILENPNILPNIKEMISINSDKEDFSSNSLPMDIKMLKDVGEAYMGNFGLTEEDFKLMKDAGINLIEGNFDICAKDQDVQVFLDSSNKYGIQVVMPAGSGEAEWGYECDKETYPKDQQPQWNKEAVVEWINKWKDNPAIYAWDTSNEAGSVFPNASDKNMLTKEQLKQAYRDVKTADPDHPVMIRMNGWFFYDYDSNFFRDGNPFDKDMSDMVMVNAYSNVDEYYKDFVPTVTQRAVTNIQKIAPNNSVIIALGAWKEKPLWVRPKIVNLKNEISQLEDMGIRAIAFFKYGAKGSEWYLPDSKEGDPDLFKVISSVK